MKMLAATARLGTLALTAALGSTAFAQTAEQEGRMLLAMNEPALNADWQPATRAEEQAQAEAVERELAVSAEAISRKLDEQLEDRLSRKLELSI
ncbi:MAG: hypothetical protein R3311_19355 [Oceanisphaera sp.]|nr:hypothetical protein [Oceanisphaera sp.]